MRHQLTVTRGTQTRLMLCEEASRWQSTGAEPLTELKAPRSSSRLLGAEATRNMPPPIRDRHLQQALEAIARLEPQTSKPLPAARPGTAARPSPRARSSRGQRQLPGHRQPAGGRDGHLRAGARRCQRQSRGLTHGPPHHISTRLPSHPHRGRPHPADELTRLTTLPTPDKTEQTESHYGIPKGLKLRDEIARFFKIAQNLWHDFQPCAIARTSTPMTSRCANSWCRCCAMCSASPTLRQAPAWRSAGTTYNIGHAARGGRLPVVCGRSHQGLDDAANASASSTPRPTRPPQSRSCWRRKH
jgi:hypothetical protein